MLAQSGPQVVRCLDSAPADRKSTVGEWRIQDPSSQVPTSWDWYDTGQVRPLHLDCTSTTRSAMGWDPCPDSTSPHSCSCLVSTGWIFWWSQAWPQRTLSLSSRGSNTSHSRGWSTDTSSTLHREHQLVKKGLWSINLLLQLLGLGSLGIVRTPWRRSSAAVFAFLDFTVSLLSSWKLSFVLIS